MALTPAVLEEAFKSLGLTVATDGTSFVHTTQGRYAPVINTIITIDDDGAGATLIASLGDSVTTEKRTTVYELLNLIHGQSLWNVRFHLDEEGRLLSIGKFSLWGRPFHGVQFGDIIFSMLVTTDRLFPCLEAIRRDNLSATDAFTRFFLQKPETHSSSDA